MWLNQLDAAAHTVAEYEHDTDLVGTTVSGDYTAYYHENRLYSVRKKGSSVTALVYAGNPYKAIERAADVSAFCQRGTWSDQKLFDDGFGGGRVGYICSACGKFVPNKGKRCQWDGKCPYTKNYEGYPEEWRDL